MLLIVALLLPIAALFGVFYVLTHMESWYYERYGYCGTCHRFSPEREDELR